MKWFNLISFVFLIHINLYAKNYETFYLGFHAEEKMKVIKDFLSEEGKSYPIGQGSVFVKDNPEVLQNIKEFLKNQAGIQSKGLVVKLREKKNSKRDLSSVKGRLSTNPLSGSIELGQKEIESINNSQLTITALSGHAAKLSDISRSERLTVFRNRYMSLYLKEPIVDGFEFEVLPVLSGDYVKLVIKRSYYATLNGRRRVFKESTIKTTKVVKLGQWSDLGGVSNSSSNSSRSITGLSLSSSEVNSGFNMDVRVDLQVK